MPPLLELRQHHSEQDQFRARGNQLFMNFGGSQILRFNSLVHEVRMLQTPRQ